MGRKKIERQVENIVIKEKKRNPFLGVRRLANFLKDKYNISISKSAICKILNTKGIREKRGRKKTLPIYQKRNIENCGLMLLKAIGYSLGVFSYLVEQLHIYFPKIKADLLEKIIIFSSFSSFFESKIEENINNKNLLRLVNFKKLPFRKLNYFKREIYKYQPMVSLKELKKKLTLVSTVKIIFNNGFESKLDAGFNTFWEDNCKIGCFYSPISLVKKRLEEMLEIHTLMVGYTKSFSYLSSLVVSFIRGIESGIKEILFLNTEGKIIEKNITNSVNTFFVGYLPQAISKNIIFLEKNKKNKKFYLENFDEFYYVNILTKFLQLFDKKELTLNNVLIYRKSIFFPVWGILTNKTECRVEDYLKKYLFFWPKIEEKFSRDLKIIEKFRFEESKDIIELKEILSDFISFKKEEDFFKIADLLYQIGKLKLGDFEINRKGKVFTSKNFIKILNTNYSKELKEKFNYANFYLEKKHVFIL
ncbi:MAG: helix-turn-helix domain-containing protein [Candidatus Aenigmatarchaeota archaeon]